MDLQHAVHPSPPVRAADCLPLWGDTAARPQTFGMPVRLFAARHLSTASLEFLEVLGLDAQPPPSLLDPLGVSFEALEAFLEPPGVLLRPSWSLLGRSWGPVGDSWGALWGVLGPLGRLLDPLEAALETTKTSQ